MGIGALLSAAFSFLSRNSAVVKYGLLVLGVAAVFFYGRYTAFQSCQEDALRETVRALEDQIDDLGRQYDEALTTSTELAVEAEQARIREDEAKRRLKEIVVDADTCTVGPDALGVLNEGRGPGGEPVPPPD